MKTAQGPSTVAINTTASIVLALLNVLGLDPENGNLLCVLAMGAGSMMMSHANDSYFWLISKFSGIDMDMMLRGYSTVTFIMDLSAFILTWVLSLFML